MNVRLIDAPPPHFPESRVWLKAKNNRLLEARVRFLPLGDYRPELRIYVQGPRCHETLLLSMVLPTATTSTISHGGSNARSRFTAGGKSSRRSRRCRRSHCRVRGSHEQVSPRSPTSFLLVRVVILRRGPVAREGLAQHWKVCDFEQVE